MPGLVRSSAPLPCPPPHPPSRPLRTMYDILGHRNEWWVPGKIVEARQRLAQYWKVRHGGRGRVAAWAGGGEGCGGAGGRGSRRGQRRGGERMEAVERDGEGGRLELRRRGQRESSVPRGGGGAVLGGPNSHARLQRPTVRHTVNLSQSTDIAPIRYTNTPPYPQSFHPGPRLQS